MIASRAARVACPTGVVALLACASAEPADNHPQASSSATASASATPSSAHVEPPVGAYDAHEWGLIDVSPSGTALLAGHPSTPTEDNSPRRKPVIYLHLADGAPALDVTVTVKLSSGSFIEKYPGADISGDGLKLTWPALHVTHENCPVPRNLERESRPCRTPDGLCEIAELATYETNDSSCIHRDDNAYNHLFYRANGSTPPLPFEFAIVKGVMTAQHTRASDVVGPILYVHRDPSFVAVSMTQAPAVGESSEAPAASDAAAARSAIDKAMQDTGLTSAEIAAFDRAWSDELFGAAPTRDIGARRSPSVGQNFILYVMPPSLTEGVSKLSFAPSARSVKRFFLVRVPM